MNVVGIIQARMGSSRLPGKVLLPILGRPMLHWVVHRTGKAVSIDEVVVATTTDARDDVIVDLCAAEGWHVSRGSEDDVLDRYHAAAQEFGATHVVRVTSDCPLIEPEVIDRIVFELRSEASLDYASNTIPPRTFPRGLDTEAMKAETLHRAWLEDREPGWREHVTPYVYRHPELFKIKVVTDDVDRSDMRWTVDTPEDFELATRVYDAFGHGDFRWHDVLDLLEEHPDWADLNRHVQQKQVS
jgi:spore coat polysaccharide biosynthesis protein SpsF